MKRGKQSPIVAWLTTISLLFSLAAGIMIGDNARVHAAPKGGNGPHKGDKVSSDLRDKVKKAKRNECVKTIIDPAGDWNTNLDSLVSKKGGKVSRSFKNFKSHSVCLPAATVEDLANDPTVDYVSLDRDVQAFGHVSLTTGTDAARTMSGGLPYDGSGIGIAVMDSGIDQQHVSFEDAASQSRIAVSIDFTDENRTDDPYGHGTHVASIAAGNSTISQGAYTGVAPNAKLINLRVLDSHGAGST